MKRLLFLCFLVSSCISKTEEQSETQAAESSAVTAHDLSFTRLDGAKVHLESLQGKVVVLNFWATWCPPCIREMPSLQALYEKYEKHPGVEFLVVEVENKPALAQQFIEDKGFTFPVYSPDGILPETFLGQSIPTTVILDKSGEIILRHEGMTDFMSDDFVNRFEGILSK